MLAWPENEKIAIWGTGCYGKKLYYKYRHKYNVKYFIDNNINANPIDNVPVRQPNHIGNEKILIAVKEYRGICKQCHEMGRRFWLEYLPYKFFEYEGINILELYELVGQQNVEEVLMKLVGNRKMVMIIGNCQTTSIREFMCGSRKFIEDYIFIDFPRIHTINSQQEDILLNCKFLFERCDLCITQIISDKNRFSDFFCTDNIIKMLGKNTRIVKIPTCYFDIYYPQTIHQRYPIKDLYVEGRIYSFPYGDCILDELSQMYTVKEIIEIVKSDRLFTYEFLESFFVYRINDLKEREKKCDVSILDFILENYRKELLFYSNNHPTNKVITELTRRLLLEINVEYDDFEGNMIVCNELNPCQELLYPSVAKVYGLKFEKKKYRDVTSDKLCSFDEYVAMYLSYVHDKK